MSPIEFRDLSPEECEEVLQRNSVGRLGVVADERIEIVPLHYSFDDGWIFGRTTMGRKLGSIHRNWWVAFEVDEVDATFDWRSVVVHGGFYLLDSSAGPHDAELADRARTAIRRVVPEAFSPADPVPDLELLFGIAVQEMSGRAASSGAAIRAGIGR
jgi:uncharacterized protein